MAKCKICKRTETKCVYNRIYCCSLCHFFIKYQDSPHYFIRLKLNNKVIKERKKYAQLFVENYPELLNSNKEVKCEDFENVRKDVIFAWKRELLKNS